MIMKLLGGISRYWSLGVGFLLAGLAIAVKFLTAKNSRLQRKVDTVTARRHHDRVVAKQAQKNREEFLSRSRKIAEEVEKKKSTKELSEPNKW